MKSASTALIALLAGNQFVMADLLTLTTIGGSVYRYTSADIDLTVGANTFLSAACGVMFKRGRTRVVIGVEVDTLEVTFQASATGQLLGTSFLAAVHNGALDGARLKLERVFMPTWGDTSAGTLVLFSGRVAESSFSRTEARVTVKSDLELLNIKMPRNLYQPACVHTLFDSGCGLSKSGHAVTGIVLNSSTALVVNCNHGQAAGYFDRGVVSFTGGANAGVTRNVKSYTPGVLSLNYPLPHVPVYGDTISVYPGCDKKQATCSGKFGNVASFRGFPYIPTPETAL